MKEIVRVKTANDEFLKKVYLSDFVAILDKLAFRPLYRTYANAEKEFYLVVHPYGVDFASEGVEPIRLITATLDEDAAFVILGGKPKTLEGLVEVFPTIRKLLS